MSDLIFCLVGLLRYRKQVGPVISLLPESRRGGVEKLLEELGKLEEADLRSRWRQTRESEQDALRTEATRQTGVSLGAVPPWAERWLCERVRVTHGRKDHQG